MRELLDNRIHVKGTDVPSTISSVAPTLHILVSINYASYLLLSHLLPQREETILNSLTKSLLRLWSGPSEGPKHEEQE